MDNDEGVLIRWKIRVLCNLIYKYKFKFYLLCIEEIRVPSREHEVISYALIEIFLVEIEKICNYNQEYRVYPKLV